MKKKSKNNFLCSYFLIILNYLSNFIFSLIKIDNKIFNILTFVFLFLIELILLKNLYSHNIFAIMCVFIYYIIIKQKTLYFIFVFINIIVIVFLFQHNNK